MKRWNYLVLTLAMAAIFLFWGNASLSAWPFEGKGAQEKKVAGASNLKTTQKSSNQQEVSKASVSDNQNKEAGEAEEAAPALVPELPKLPEIPKAPKVSEVADLPEIPSVGSYSNVSDTSQDLEILKIQKQIKEIIAINESLKFQYRNQAQEIQKISDQAQAHKKILEGLNPVPATPGEETLKNEKINIIKKQTQESQDFISSLDKNKKAAGIQSSTPAENSKANTTAPAR